MKLEEIIIAQSEKIIELENKLKESERKENMWYSEWSKTNAELDGLKDAEHNRVMTSIDETYDYNHYDTVPAMPGEYQKEEPLTGVIGVNKE